MSKCIDPKYDTPDWHTQDRNERCRARGVARCVYDFMTHNLGQSAADAALRALPIVATRQQSPEP